MDIFIIGSGNVAFHLGKAFSLVSHNVIGYYGRSEKGKENFPFKYYREIENVPATADLYLVCLSDDSIEGVVNMLPSKIRETKIIAHTSGSKSVEETLQKCEYGGVFYPLQTFSINSELEYSQIPFCISSTDESTFKTLKNLAFSISKSVHEISDNQRNTIHLSAVIINNFVNHLIYKSEELLELAKIDASILQPLLKETILKQSKIGSFDAQTGPARRNDKNTIRNHLSKLKTKSEKRLYKSISKSISKTYNK